MQNRVEARRSSGQAMVEFALLFPLLTLLLFAIVQYGLMFAAYITVRNASVLGARQATLYQRTAAEAQEAALNALTPMLDRTRGTAVLTTTTVGGRTGVVMTVSYNMPLIIPFVVPGTGNTRTLTARTVMQ